jgi:hypothetical protein
VKAYVSVVSFAAILLLKVGSGCDDGSDSAGPTIQCYEIVDGGSSSTCTFGSANEAFDASCEKGFTSGVCPTSVSSSDLVGCCLETLTASQNGAGTLMATNGECYYSSSAAKDPMSACTGVTDSGYTKMWSKIP